MTLIAHWKLQENAGSTAFADEVGSYNATAARNTSTTFDISGPGSGAGGLPGAYACNGTSDMATFSNVTLTGQMTVCYWAKRSSTSGADMVLGFSSDSNSAKAGFPASSTTAFWRGVLNATSQTPNHGITSTAWHHYAWIRNGSNVWSFYVDGSLITSSLATYSGNSIWSRIGNDASNNWFVGSIADVRIYDSNESANLATIIAEKDGTPDATPPEFVSATIDSLGTTVAVVFDEPVVITNANGLTFDPSGSAATLTYANGSGTDTINFTSSREILEDETVDIEYDDATGNIEDGAGNPLESFGPTSVTNNSTERVIQTPTAPELFDVPYSLPTGGTTYTPADSAAFTTALAAAVGGDVIILTAGVTYTANYKLLDWGAGTDWIYIISSALASLPSKGARVDLDDIANMPTITSTSNAPIHADFGAHHYRLVGLRVVTGAADRLATLQFGYGGDYSTDATTDADLPHHITIDRCVIGSTSDAHRLRHGMIFSGNYMACVDSYIYNIKDTSDAQAIFIFNGGAHYKVVNNYLSATGENMMVGGTDPKIADATSSDIEVRGNYMFKPTVWFDTDTWNEKNLFEIKHAQRVLVTGNVMENNWEDAQGGIAFLLTVRNQSNLAPWAVVQDIDVTNNIIRNVAGGFNITGEDDVNPSLQTKRVRIHNNLIENVTRDYATSGPAYLTTSTPDVPIYDLIVTHNTFLSPTDEVGPSNHVNFNSDRINVNGLILQDNIGCHGSFHPTWSRSTVSTHSSNVWAMVAANSRYATNKTNFANYNPGDFMADPELTSVGFVDLGGNNYRLDASSTFKGDGTLGSDPGIDQDELEEETFGAISGDWSIEGPAGEFVAPLSSGMRLGLKVGM